MINQIYDDLFTFENLYRAYLNSRKAKRKKRTIVRFELNTLSNLQELYEKLKQRNFKFDKYHTFVVQEPKRREIQTQDFAHRIVQHLLCDDVLMPYFSKRAIIDNCVCQKGKGMHFALSRLEKHSKTI